MSSVPTARPIVRRCSCKAVALMVETRLAVAGEALSRTGETERAIVPRSILLFSASPKPDVIRVG